MARIWKGVLIGALVLGLMFLSLSTFRTNGPAALAVDQGATTTKITVTGQGTVKVKADTVIVSLGVTTDGATADEAQSKNADLMSQVTGTVKRMLTEKDEWETTGLSLNAQYDWSESGKGKLIGFQASNTIQVTLSDPTRAGEVVDACVKSGANSIGGITFTLRDPEPARLDAIKAAMRNAATKADAALSVAGKSVKEILEVNVSDSYYPPVVYKANYDMAPAPSGGATTPISPGNLEVQATVTVVYSF